MVILPCILQTVILFFGTVFAKPSDISNEPDYYPKLNPNPNNINDLNVHHIDQYFDMFTRFYEIEYKDSAHKRASYEIFTDNLKKIIIMNKFTTAVKFGINEFSHLTIDEFTKKYTGFNDTGIDNTDVKTFRYNSTEGAPLNLDWRELEMSSPVRHQGACKSSYVFSAIANIEAQVSKNFKYLPRLSEQQAYDCEPTGSCKYGGMPHKVLESIMRVGGIEELINYIYDPKDQRKCKVNKSAMVVRVTSVQRFKLDYEDGLVALLVQYGPVVTTMYVSESVKNYFSGILRPTDCNKKPNHAVLLVGYGVTEDEIPYWIVKNSWGTQWGDIGYIRLIRGEWACHIGEYIVTATVETIPRGDNLTTTTAAASYSNGFSLPLLNSSLSPFTMTTATSAAPTEDFTEKVTISSHQKEATKPTSFESFSSEHLKSTTNIDQTKTTQMGYAINLDKVRREIDIPNVVNSDGNEPANENKPRLENENNSSENKPSSLEKKKSSEEMKKTISEKKKLLSDKKKSSEEKKKSSEESKISSEENKKKSGENKNSPEENKKMSEETEKSSEETKKSFRENNIPSKENKEASLETKLSTSESTTPVIPLDEAKYRAAESSEVSAEDIIQRASGEGKEKASSPEDSDNYGLKVTQIIDGSVSD